jgi:hypothetical protein
MMPYALFEDEERLTRSFASRQEAWDAAERAGLVEIAADGKKLLDDHLKIRPCFDPPEDDEAGFDFRIY